MWNPLEYLREKSKSYQLTFGSPAGIFVEKDLARFCYATKTCFVPGDPALTNILLGRQQVWYRIQKYKGLKAEEIAALMQDEIRETLALREQVSEAEQPSHAAAYTDRRELSA